MTFWDFVHANFVGLGLWSIFVLLIVCATAGATIESIFSNKRNTDETKH